MKLSRDKIVETALALLQDEGLGALNMRSLAGRLRVQQSSLYRHVANKGDLISLMVSALHEKAFHSIPRTLEWRGWLVSFGTAFHLILRETRDSAKLCILAGPSPKTVETVIEEFSAPLATAGISKKQALTFHTAVVAFTIGWLMFEQNDRFNHHLGQMIDFPSGFDTGLEALAFGFHEDNQAVKASA